ncbi:MAG: hypothetical protein IKV97_07070, partial [Clostridia bacterium]|nr:hypothetical protein [Clostridia bacterium]
NEINLCGTEFSITPPYKQSTLKGVTSARMGQYGGLTFDGGPAISATEYIYRRDMLTWSPAIMKELGNAYTLSVSGNKNKYPSFGVRFHINREFNSYYLLNVNGSKNDASSPAWTLYKVTDGTNPVELTKSEKSARVVGDFELEMQVNGGNVTVSVTHSGSTETKTFSDSAPFAHTAGDAGTVAFVKSDGGEVKIKAVSVDAENAEDVRVITAVDDNGKALGTAKVTTASFSGGDGITYTGSSSEQKIGTSDFLMMGPATGYSPLNSPIQAVMQKGGPLVISAGANQAALNYNDRKCMVVWKPDGMMAAIKNYRITADAYVENSHPGLGMRFHINSDRSSYYMLNIHSPQRDPGKPLWVLYKTVGGKTFPVMTSDAVTSVDTSNYMRYDYKLDVTVVDNYVTVAVTWDGGKKSEYKTFCDQEPFSYGANSSAFIGFTKNGSGEVKINALKLETYSQSERVQNHRFGDGIIIRKIENPGNTPAKVFVSNDTNGIYELLGVVPAKGKFVNCLTAKKMTNVRVEGGSDLRFYSDIKDIPAYAVAGELLPLSARIGGKDAPYATFESSRKNIIEISDGKLIPLQTGKTDITAADSGASYTENDVESRFFGKWEESFDSYGNTSVKESSRKTSARDVTVSGDWILRQNIGGPINANPKAMVSDGAMLLSGPSLVPTDKRIAYLIYDKELAGLGGRYEINAELNKYNAASGIGMKFHIHDNYDQSYYMLMLNGTNADMNTWTFYKVVRGKVVDSVKGPSFGSPAESGNGAYSGGDISVKIKVDGNRINWSVYGARVGESATLSAGAYTDDGFTPISGSYGRIAFVASNAANISTDGYHKIYSVSVTENVTKFFRPTVKEYDEGNIVFLPAYNYGNSARFIIAASNGGSMHDFDIFSNADFSDLSAKAFYIPKDMFGKTKIFVWDMTKLRPFGKFITELG